MAKKAKRTIVSGIAHIHSSNNNTIISFSDEQGNIVAWSSSGAIGYKGTKKATPYAAGLAAEAVAKKVQELGIKKVRVHINGTGQGKDTAVRSIQASGIDITEINDLTPIPHNGCRPPKKPR